MSDSLSCDEKETVGQLSRVWDISDEDLKGEVQWVEKVRQTCRRGI